MGGTVKSSGFTGTDAGVNGVSTITATRNDIIRSLLTVGYPSRKAAVALVGPWREKLLVAMATGYLTPTLGTTQYFLNLEPTEKVGVTFLLGEAFTHWYAQEKLNMDYLVHVAGLPSCNWTQTTTRLKAGAAAQPAKSRPDFIGFRQDERHVFESKGRMKVPGTKTIKKALGQVSKLHHVNGTGPTTRCACFFMFKKAGVSGEVIDPPRSIDGYDVKFDNFDAARRAYAFFVQDEVADLSKEVAQGFVGREVAENIYYAADKKIVDLLSKRPLRVVERQQRYEEFLGLVAQRRPLYLELRTPDRASGRDGIILLNRRDKALASQD